MYETVFSIYTIHCHLKQGDLSKKQACIQDFWRAGVKTFSPLSQLEFVPHKITIALKFMSYINSDLPIPAKKLQTPGQPQCTKWVYNVINTLLVPPGGFNIVLQSTAWKLVGVAMNVECGKREQFKSNQEHKTTYIFSNLVTNAGFLQLQGYINIQQASGFGSNFTRISFQKFSYLAMWFGACLWFSQLQLIFEHLGYLANTYHKLDIQLPLTFYPLTRLSKLLKGEFYILRYDIISPEERNSQKLRKA